MKKILLFILIIVSVNGFSQSNPKPKDEPKDSVNNQTIFYITVDDLNRYADKLKDWLTQRQWEAFAAGLQAIINDMIADKKNSVPRKP